MRRLAAAILAISVLACASEPRRADRVLNRTLYVSAIADDASTFAAINSAKANGHDVIEGNPIRKPLIGLGPAGAFAVQVALDFVVIKACDALAAHGHTAIARGLKMGFIAGHAIGVGNNLHIVISEKR